VTFPPAAGFRGAPLKLEVRLAQRLRQGQQGVLRLQLTGLGLTDPVAVELVAESGLWPESQERSTHLAPGGRGTLPGITFVPQNAGGDEVRLTLTARRADGLPLGRWYGSHEVTIAEAPRELPGQIAVEKGGTVIVANSPQLGDLVAHLPGTPDAWQGVTLEADVAFEGRLGRACPAPTPGAPGPISARQAWPAHSSPCAAVVRLRDGRGGLARAVAVVCGTAAALGRGGNPAVAWWLQPAPYDEHHHGRSGDDWPTC
jgi:hypothetical protein